MIYRITVEEVTEEEYQYKIGDNTETRKREDTRKVFMQEVSRLDLIAVISAVNQMNVTVKEK